MADMNGLYLIEDWTCVTEENPSPAYMFIKQTEIVEFLDKAHKEGLQVKAYRVGDCVLDWAPAIKS